MLPSESELDKSSLQTNMWCLVEGASYVTTFTGRKCLILSFCHVIVP
jgi:hypothetical protein